jgi:hypothetical protein
MPSAIEGPAPQSVAELLAASMRTMSLTAPERRDVLAARVG